MLSDLSHLLSVALVIASLVYLIVMYSRVKKGLAGCATPGSIYYIPAPEEINEEQEEGPAAEAEAQEEAENGAQAQTEADQDENDAPDGGEQVFDNDNDAEERDDI